jgi:hypothetical protein
MEVISFIASELEPSLFICQKDQGFVVIWLHIDNGFAMALSNAVLEELHNAMSREMEVKWLDKVEKIVGIRIEEVNGKVKMNQHMMVEQILESYSCKYYPRRSTLQEMPLETNNGDEVDATGYRSTLGSLMYLCSGTRPELTYSVNLLACFNANPSAAHWDALDILMGYLKRTKDTPPGHPNVGPTVKMDNGPTI